MAELIVSNIIWKKGETGTQKFEIYDSDGVTRRNITGKTVSFKFWLPGASSNKGSGTLSHTDSANGKAQYTVQSADTDTIATYLAELVEDPSGSPLKSKTFTVDVVESAPA